jgi:hypothetical protein
MTRAGTLEKLIRTDCDQRHIESQRKRIKHLEEIIVEHRTKVTEHGTREGRGCDRDLWDKMGACWEVEDE